MKIWVFNILIIGTLCLMFTDKSRASDICVLVYERQHSPIAEGTLNVYQNYAKATVTLEARPRDIIECIKQGATEIVMIAHAMKIQSSGQIRLGYFARQPGQSQKYLVGFFLDNVFKVASDILSAQEAMSQKKLIKFRMMACDQNELLQAYPSLQKMLGAHGLSFDPAPDSWLLSRINDVPTSGFNTAWLAQDISCADFSTSWRTEANNWCEADYWPGCDRVKAQYCLPPRP